MAHSPTGRPPGRPRKATPKEVLTGTTVMGADEFADDETEDQDQPVEQVAGSEEPVSSSQLALTTNQLGKAIQALVESQPVKRVPWAKFKTRSPFNPTGNRRRKLDRRMYQNGRRLNIKLLHDEEIRLLNLLKPGRFIENRVAVVEMINGGNIDVNVVYPNKGIDQQLENKSHWRNLTELLQKCVTEASQNEEVEQSTRRRAKRA